MGIIKSTVVVGQKPPKKILKEARKAARYPINYTADCPPSTPEALKEFAQLAAERDRRKRNKQ
ncbi:MAG: hypothetical protein FWD78_11970 [Treponema sp.]|nr:hypothetical protein [Treponema sp.]